MEVLLALGLSVTLLIAIYAALGMYAQFTTAGRDNIARAQVVRALVRKMSTDIRSVAYQPPESEEGGGSSAVSSGGTLAASSGGRSGGTSRGSSGASSSDSGDTAMPVDVVDPSDAYATGNIGVLGDAETLVLSVSRPSRPALSTATEEDPAALNIESDSKSVAYFLAVPGADGLRGIVGDLAAEQNPDDSRIGDVQGLARLEGDRVRMQFADERLDYEAQAAATKLLAPEINVLRFSYFDGTYWFDSWDSVTSGGLPTAIGVTLGLRIESKNPPDSRTTDDTEEQSQVYEFVVALPLAEPAQSASEF